MAKDGSGQFETIADAVDNARPGTTINVIDNGVYSEPLAITDPKKHAGVTIISQSGARLDFKERQAGIKIQDVPGVLVSGFEISGGPKLNAIISVSGNSPGARLQNLNLYSEWTPTRPTTCIELAGLNLSDSDDPVMVKNCRVQGSAIAIRIDGLLDYSTPRKCRRIVIRNNRLENSHMGIYVRGLVQQLQIVANRISSPNHPALAAMQFERLMEGTKKLVIANNTLWNTGHGVRVWDARLLSREVRFANNLFLGSPEDDFVIVGSAARVNPNYPPGDVKGLLSSWDFDRNWRRKRKTEAVAKRGAWVPPANGDEQYTTTPVVSLNSDGADFLRPAVNSKLATAGAGKTDPALPGYIGALPPKGTPAWDWSRTWRAPPGKNKVLTVSKDEKDGGKYRTINAALKDAKPWDAVRVLDNATYEEIIKIVDSKQHTGVRLAAIAGAVLQLAPHVDRGVTIRDVPEVRMTGFRFLATRGRAVDGRYCIHVSGNSPGVTLDSLKFETNVPVVCVAAQSATGKPERPITIQRCAIRSSGESNDGIRVFSNPGTNASQYVRVESNEIHGALRGIWFSWSLEHVLVAENRVHNCGQAGLQVENPRAGCRSLLCTNNTIFRGSVSFRLWEDIGRAEVFRSRAEVRNNLFFGSLEADMLYLQQRIGKTQKHVGDQKKLVTAWHFGNNQRDLHASRSANGIPQAPSDVNEDPILVVNKDNAESSDFLRPKQQSAHATGGAGGDLPRFIGALPPKGVQPWDWSITWRSRMMRAKYGKTTASSSGDD